jgi:rubrerythrin
MTVVSAAEALRWAMEIEENGEAFYNTAAARSADADVKALFEDLAVRERGHYEVFQKMLEKVKPDPDLSSVGPQYADYEFYLQAVLANALFAGKDKGLTLARQAEDRETALQAAMSFEKDTLLFFYDLREMVSEAARGTITAVIQEEKTHLRRLAKML